MSSLRNSAAFVKPLQKQNLNFGRVTSVSLRKNSTLGANILSQSAVVKFEDYRFKIVSIKPASDNKPVMWGSKILSYTIASNDINKSKIFSADKTSRTSDYTITSKFAAASLHESGRKAPAPSIDRPLTEKSRLAQRRAEAMLSSGRGYNVSLSDDDKEFKKIGGSGTYLTDKRFFESLKNRSTFDKIEKVYKISRSDVANIERELGLDFGKLSGYNKEGKLKSFKAREIEFNASNNPRAVESGNRYYYGTKRHLPGGSPELLIDSVDRDGPHVKQITEFHVVE